MLAGGCFCLPVGCRPARLPSRVCLPLATVSPHSASASTAVKHPRCLPVCLPACLIARLPACLPPCLSGVSEAAVELADAQAIVTTAGFVDSLNLSVAAALCMYEARRCRQERLG